MPAAATAPKHPLAYLCDDWLAAIQRGLQVRDERFGKYAQEAEQFFDGERNWMWSEKYARGGSGINGFLSKEGMMPTFKISVNKLFEAVALFGPALYAQNPNVLVTARDYPVIPPEALGFAQEDLEYQQLFMQEALTKSQRDACAAVKTAYLNWLQQENDKKTQARRAITEALVAGLGVLEVGMFAPPFSDLAIPKASYLSWKDLVVDPDADYWEEVQWIAIRRRRTVNKTEDAFGLEKGDLKGHYQSAAAQSTRQGRRDARANRDAQSFDIIEYWEVYSKNGMGDKLAGKNSQNSYYDFDAWGDFCYLVVADGIKFPLNLPSNYLNEETDQQALMSRVEWPIPFWLDPSSDGGWPIVRLSFYEKPRSVWPISLFKPAIGELQFVNWCLSFLADKVAQSCTTYLGVLKAANVQLQKQLANGSMTPFQVLEISEAIGKTLNESVQFLQVPDFPQHIWTMIAQVLELIDKRTGLTELIYGLSGRQMRSAAEANIKDSNIAVRPDDMAQSIENALSLVNVREMQAARWLCEPKDIAPAVGQMGAMVWQNLVMTQTVDSVVRDFDYRIEAGSARKPNKQGKIAALNEMGQAFVPIAAQLIPLGVVNPINAYFEDLAKAMDLDPSRYMIELAPAGGEQGPLPEEQAAQAQLQLKQAEMEFKQLGMQQSLVFDEEKHDQEMRQDEEKFRADLKHDDAKAKQQVATAKAVAKSKPKPKPAGAKR